MLENWFENVFYGVIEQSKEHADQDLISLIDMVGESRLIWLFSQGNGAGCCGAEAKARASTKKKLWAAK